MPDQDLSARIHLIDRLKAEFVGPGSEGLDGGDIETEIISENPLKRYALGILYPQRSLLGDDIDSGDNDDQESEYEDLDDFDPVTAETNNNEANNKKSSESDSEQEISIVAANQFCPSSYGITFYLKRNNPKMHIKISAAKYERLKPEEAFVILNDNDLSLFNVKSNENYNIEGHNFHYISSISVRKYREVMSRSDYLRFSRIHDKTRNLLFRGYRRTPFIIYDSDIVFSPETKNLESIISKEISIRVKCRLQNNELYKITIAILNLNHVPEGSNKYSDPEKCFFQNKMSVMASDGYPFVELPSLRLSPTIDKLDKLLYKNRKIFACGHGCSADWNHSINPTEVSSTFIPHVEVPKIEAYPKRIRSLRLNIFGMQYLAFHPSKTDIIEEFRQFVDDYEKWNEENKQKSADLESVLKQTAESAIDNGRLIVSRLRKGISILSEDKTAWKALKLTNLAMTMQRYHTDNFVRKPRTLADPLPKLPSDYNCERFPNTEWRPFQLAFLLLSIEATIDANSQVRHIADLIWFPTGGGKTEAYLGVIAFTIFYRRLCFGDAGAGTSVIMRYTLRLLTAQQFERASTLVAACEYIRRSYPNINLGNTPINIGLWVGLDNTPNTQKQAEIAVVEMISKPHDFQDNNPFQMIQCPWCGTKLFNEQWPARSGYISKPKFHFECIEPSCPFHDKLPLQVVDEHLYSTPPSLLFATVDKFAKLAWEPETRNFFGLQKNTSGKVTYIRRPPDLIIQDELHLIAGPLGSLFGIYELMIDYLCTREDMIPRIVCSTATIKKADDQVRILFNRDTCIFPPSGIDITDNYFSVEIPFNESPGRCYLGLMSAGITRMSAQVKMFSNLLFNNVQTPENSRDTYYTLVCYFNTIKELGQAASLFDADIKEKIQTLQSRFRIIFEGKDRPMWRKELTGRAFTKELPKTLKQLEEERYPSNKAIPAVLTTNMFSVGVDISRLNLMAMIGQPKSTAEYIQSTSRVGRVDPGLIVTMLDGFCVRDRSHFENFKAYHESFYRFVEPAGSTPYSEPARRRALHTIIIMAARLLGGLDDNKDADKFTVELIPASLTEHLKHRIANNDRPELEGTIAEWNLLIDDWKRRTGTKLIFREPYNLYRKHEISIFPVLMRSFSDKENDGNIDSWPVLTSMRSVDVPCICSLED
jgi:hypothetical protein